MLPTVVSLRVDVSKVSKPVQHSESRLPLQLEWEPSSACFATEHWERACDCSDHKQHLLFAVKHFLPRFKKTLEERPGLEKGEHI